MESEQKKKSGGLFVLIIVAILIGWAIAQRVATVKESEFFGHWQMTAESWQVEQMSRQYGASDNWWSDVFFFAPGGWRFSATFHATDLSSILNSEAYLEGDFRYDGNVLVCDAPAFGTRRASVTWMNDKVIAVQNENGETRYYRRQ